VEFALCKEDMDKINELVKLGEDTYDWSSPGKIKLALKSETSWFFANKIIQLFFIRLQENLQKISNVEFFLKQFLGENKCSKYFQSRFCFFSCF
jgi:hypothetical protein